jgi:hypothetical protein
MYPQLTLCVSFDHRIKSLCGFAALINHSMLTRELRCLSLLRELIIHQFTQWKHKLASFTKSVVIFVVVVVISYELFPLINSSFPFSRHCVLNILRSKSLCNCTCSFKHRWRITHDNVRARYIFDYIKSVASFYFDYIHFILCNTSGQFCLFFFRWKNFSELCWCR